MTMVQSALKKYKTEFFLVLKTKTNSYYQKTSTALDYIICLVQMANMPHMADGLMGYNEFHCLLYTSSNHKISLIIIKARPLDHA